MDALTTDEDVAAAEELVNIIAEDDGRIKPKAKANSLLSGDKSDGQGRSSKELGKEHLWDM